MFVISYADKKKEMQENAILKEELEISEETLLHVHTGYYVCPKDRINQSSPFPKILLNNSIIDLIQKKDMEGFNQLSKCLQALGINVDREDYEHFRNWSSFAFLFACSEFLSKNSKKMQASKCFSKHKKEILPKVASLFIEALKKAQQSMNVQTPTYFDYYNYLKGEFVDLPSSIELYWNDVPKKYNVFGHIMGALLEEEIGSKDKFTEDLIFQDKEHYFIVWSSLVSHSLRQKGVLIKFDADKEIQKEMNKYAQGLGHPDFIYVTPQYIFPIDSKLNINPKIIMKDNEKLEKLVKKKYPLSRQISQKNLLHLFKKLKRCEGFSTLFDGISIRGLGLISKELKPKKEKKITPMQVLGKDLGKSTGAVARLWSEGEKLTENFLIKNGVKDIKVIKKALKIYNDMLKNR